MVVDDSLVQTESRVAPDTQAGSLCSDGVTQPGEADRPGPDASLNPPARLEVSWRVAIFRVPNFRQPDLGERVTNTR